MHDYDPIRKKMEYVHEKVARYAYECGVPFHTFSSEAFHVMCEAVAQFGSGYRPPSQYMLREPLLAKAVERTREYLKEHEEEWRSGGCTIMTDGWSDRKNRSLFNLCVHCSKDTSFYTSKEVSSESHTGQFIFDWVDDCIGKIGEANIIQIVTDNASNNMLAKQMLNERHPKIFWTSCVAHTIDLMLEAISKLPKFKKVIEKARVLTTFLYAHHQTLAMMRDFTNKKEIVRPGITRFATSFLTLSSIYEVKENLRRMFSSPNWTQSAWARIEKGKASNATVMDINWWSGVKLLLKVYDPLFSILRVVDSDWKASMGFVVGMLEDTKKEIKSLYKEKENLYKPIMDIIHEKGKDRLDSPLHYAAYFLNPYYYYRDDVVKKSSMVKDATITVMETFYDDIAVIDTITEIEMLKYKRAVGSLGREAAVRAWKKPIEVFNPGNTVVN